MVAEIMENENERSLIDPIYNKFVKGVTRAIGSAEFYEFFMDSLSRAHHEIQFSNRKLVKIVDPDWVDAIEYTLDAIQSIISSPRNVIKEEDLIVNIAHAKKSTAETVRHLAQHSNLIDDFDEGRGEVTPSKLMQRFREETYGLYENRLVFTTMEYAYHFVKIRHDALFEAMSDEFGAKLKLKTNMESATEQVHMDMFLHIKQIDSALETDKKHGDIFARISRIYRVLGVFMASDFAQKMSKLNRVSGTIVKTNILKRNKDYRDVLKLWEFLRTYDDIGYTIKVVEQTPEVSEKLQEDIYRNILFNYLVLKGYLEDEEDREIPMKKKPRQRKLKPKFIRQIVEELTEDYDLPDVEVRKILIEELTKEQLMKEEETERQRIIEENEARKKAEEERLKAEQEAEEARRKAEEEAEAERIRKEKEAEEQRKRQERMEREAEERRRSRLFKKEIEFFKNNLEYQLELRQKIEQRYKSKELEDFADAVILLEQEEFRKKEEVALARKEKKENEERLIKEQEEIEQSYYNMYLNEITYFNTNYSSRLRLRDKQQEQMRLEAEARERARQKRLEKIN